MDLPVNYNCLTQYQRRQVREEYVRLQGGRCYYCGEFLDSNPSERVRKKRLNMQLFPKGFLRHPVHLHHDHDTGMTIGAIHARCNGVLFQYHGE